MAIRAGVFDKPAYRNVIVNEQVLDEQGQKMSKSRGNIVNPWQVIERYGADAVRLYIVGPSQVWLPKRFDAAQVGEVTSDLLVKLRELYKFFTWSVEGWTPAAGAPPVAERPLVDRWLLARLDEVTAAVRAAWDGYDVTAGVRAIMGFVVDDLSNWYVRGNRPPFWAPARPAHTAALATPHHALAAACRLLPPAAPFLTDFLHRALAGTPVHLARFPSVRGRPEPELLLAMGSVRRLCTPSPAAPEATSLR